MLSLPIIYLSLIHSYLITHSVIGLVSTPGSCFTNYSLVALQISHLYAELGRSFHPFLNGNIILGTSCSTVFLLFFLSIVPRTNDRTMPISPIRSSIFTPSHFFCSSSHPFLVNTHPNSDD